jgi:hypothetical protein
MFLVKNKFGQMITKSGGGTRNTTDFSSVVAISSSNITQHKRVSDNPGHNYRKRHITVPSSIIKNPNDATVPTFFNNNFFETFCLATPHYSASYIVYPLINTDLVEITLSSSTTKYFEANLTTKTNQSPQKGSIGNYGGNIDVVLFNWFDQSISDSSDYNMYKINNDRLFINDTTSLSYFNTNGIYNIYVDPNIYNLFFSPISTNLDETKNISIKIINWTNHYQLKAYWKDGNGNNDAGGYYTDNFKWIAIHKNIGDYIKVNGKPVIYTGEFDGTVNDDDTTGKITLPDYYKVDITGANLSNVNYSVLLTPVDYYNSTYMYNLQVGHKETDSFYVKYYMKRHESGQNGAYGGNSSISNLGTILGINPYKIRFQWAIFIQI